ncbi:MAG: VWA domain-containing protein [Gemmataceae bacterium]|nr:VWA domain-containing protein [Gemmataceae bacterium]
MPYTAEISRTNPSCFLFLIDQSKSMTEPLAGTTKRKADALSDAMNRLLQTLVLRCVRGEVVLDRFHVGVIGYGSQVAPALGGNLAGRSLVPLSELALAPLRVESRTRKVDDGAGGLVEQTIKFPVWFEPIADGRTPMCAALDLAWQFLTEFLAKYPACYPPMVINLTDGHPTDGNPESHAETVAGLSSNDGGVMLFNVHMSAKVERVIEFPDKEGDLPDDYARQLFRMSSVLPTVMRNTAQREGFPVSETTRGFAYNADLVSVIRFLDIGTRVDAKNLR